MSHLFSYACNIHDVTVLGRQYNANVPVYFLGLHSIAVLCICRLINNNNKYLDSARSI